MAIYMEYGLIKGDVTEEYHKDWIELKTLTFGCTRGIGGTATGAAKGREASLCSISEIQMSKPSDGASQDLMREAMIGSIPGKKVTIHLVTTGQGNQAESFTQFELENCLISAYELNSGGDRPDEQINLNFTKISYTMAQSDSDGALVGRATSYFDLATSRGG